MLRFFFVLENLLDVHLTKCCCCNSLQILSALVSSSFELRLAVGGSLVDSKSNPLHDAVPSLCTNKDGEIDITAVWRLCEADSTSGKQGRVRVSLAQHAPPMPPKFHGQNSLFVAVCDNNKTSKWIALMCVCPCV